MQKINIHKWYLVRSALSSSFTHFLKNWKIFIPWNDIDKNAKVIFSNFWGLLRLNSDLLHRTEEDNRPVVEIDLKGKRFCSLNKSLKLNSQLQNDGNVQLQFNHLWHSLFVKTLEQRHANMRRHSVYMREGIWERVF